MKLSKEERASENRRWVNAVEEYRKGNASFAQGLQDVSTTMVSKLALDISRLLPVPVRVNGVEHIGLMRVRSDKEPEIVFIVPNAHDAIDLLIQKSDSDAPTEQFLKTQALFEKLERVLSAVSGQRTGPILDA